MPSPPVIVREIYDENTSPCVSPTNENYDSMLRYHKLGNNYLDSYVNNIIAAYLDYTDTETFVISTQSYNDMMYYSELNCSEFILKFELSDSGLLTITPVPIDRKSISRYSVSLFKGLFRILNAENEPKSKLFFEFTHGRVEYRIGPDSKKWYTDNTVLVSLLIMDNSGNKRYLGVYDVSIPPDNKRYK